jgi:hypothetical protein
LFLLLIGEARAILAHTGAACRAPRALELQGRLPGRCLAREEPAAPALGLELSPRIDIEGQAAIFL